jgi:putative FmdB family regulatory protein
MPTYDYVCTSCGNAWEAEQRISAPALDECPKCHEKTAKRQISGGNFILKGGGWYSDLYSSSGNKSGSASSGATGSTTTPAAPAAPAPSAPSTPSSSGSGGGGGGGSSSTLFRGLWAAPSPRCPLVISRRSDPPSERRLLARLARGARGP